MLTWDVKQQKKKIGHCQLSKIFECKIVIISLPINLNIFLGAQKNCLIEMVFLSTHNICFVWEIRKIIFKCTLLSWDWPNLVIITLLISLAILLKFRRHRYSIALKKWGLYWVWVVSHFRPSGCQSVHAHNTLWGLQSVQLCLVRLGLG